MKIVDAFWEKRNLGVETVEFEIEADDDVSVVSTILENEKEYNVIKIPSANYRLISAVQENGYRYCEVMAHYAIDNGGLRLNSIQKRMTDSIAAVDMESAGLEELHCELNKGMFDTDRVYCDPHFTREQAANRYWGWINDEIGRGGKILKYVYKDKNIGFAGVSHNNSTVFLSGMYTDAKRGGLGIIIPVTVYNVGAAHGDKRMFGTVSSTNIGVQKMYTQTGYYLEKTETIMVKNNDTL